MKEYEVQKRLLINQLERIKKLVEVDAPEVIVAHDMAGCFRRCCAIYPETAIKFAQRTALDARCRMGICESCASQINVSSSHCERCDAKLDAAAKAHEKELEEEGIDEEGDEDEFGDYEDDEGEGAI